MTAARVITYGIDQEADFRAKNITMTAKGTLLIYISPFGNHHVKMKIIGKFNVYNVLASIAATAVSKVFRFNKHSTQLNKLTECQVDLNLSMQVKIFLLLSIMRIHLTVLKMFENSASICQKANICCRRLWWRS